MDIGNIIWALFIACVITASILMIVFGGFDINFFVCDQGYRLRDTHKCILDNGTLIDATYISGNQTGIILVSVGSVLLVVILIVFWISIKFSNKFCC
jgi:hypothetical protein